MRSSILNFWTAKAEQELLKYAYKLKVRLDVYDFDALSDDDPIGHTTILLSDIIENGEERRKKVFELIGGKYSKATLWANVAVIIVRVIFMSSFLFYYLLLNHSFRTNPNSVTNCFKFFSVLQLYNCIAPAFAFFDFWTGTEVKMRKRN